MIDHEEKIKDALEGIPHLKTLSSTWPADQTQYPAIVVELAAESARDFRDNRPYLTELVYYLRIFGTSKARMRGILAEADERMAAIGYQRTFRHEQNSAEHKQWVTRYLATVRTDE